jgi:Spy/CpxP family protein refolding chaperone
MSYARWGNVAVVGIFAVVLRTASVPGADAPASPPARGFGLGFAQGGGGLSLLRLDVVAKDLELSDDQKSSVAKLSEDVNKQMNALRDSLKDATPEQRRAKRAEVEADIAKQVAAVLNEKQQGRLNEIRLQVRGGAALAEKEVDDALKLSDDQAKQLSQLAEARRVAVRSAVEAAGNDRNAARDKISKISKDSAEKMLAVLTAEQRDQFEKMKGKKLDLGAAQFGSFGGSGRRPAGSNDKSDSK